MRTDCAIAVFDTLEQAQQAVHILDRAGFTPGHVSLVTRHIDPSSEVADELALGDDSMHDAAIGATIGGIAGLLGDAGVFFVTGVGAFVAAGPLVALTGVVVGALLGAMRGWGVHESHIEKYEQLVQNHHVLVVVHGDPAKAAEAAQLLHQTNASEVHLHAAAGEDSPEIDQE